MDVVAIGDTTDDIFLHLHDASLQCSVDGRNCKLCLDYGEKIAVNKKTIISGVGNAPNHAMGVSRLGCSSALYTIVGNDDAGRNAKSILEENHVDTSYVVFDPEHRTNLSVIINFQSERTILVYHEPRHYDLPDIGDPKWIYLTSSSGDGLQALHTQVVQFLEKHPNIKLAFNPGTHQIHLGKQELLPVLKATDLLFLNREEAAHVLEVETSDIQTLVKGFHEIGIPTVVITDGPEGSYASDGKTIYTMKRFEVKEVERTGAGDAYGSGFLSAFIRGKQIEECMKWGAANGASVVQFIGAREGLLEESSMAHMIEEYSHVVPKPFAAV